MYGKTHSEYNKKLFSDLHKGNTYTKGMKLSTEHRRKMSEIAKKRTGNKNHFFGKHHTTETKQKLSNANKGKLPPNIKQVTIDNVKYISLAEASRKLNIPVPTIHWRSKSKNYPNYISE